MAESSVSLANDQFSCSICLNLLKDPVAIPCGHSYCMSCITGCWDQDDQKGVYSCPQCRQTFTPRPVLGKNTMLAAVVEKLKRKKLQAARPAQCYAGSGDVECDVCTGRKIRSIERSRSEVTQLIRGGDLNLVLKPSLGFEPPFRDSKRSSFTINHQDWMGRQIREIHENCTIMFSVLGFFFSTVTCVEIFLTPEPKTREEFLKCCWDQDDQKGVYSCPQCRQTFTTRPVLGKNTMLAEVVEKLKKTKLQAARPDQCYAGSGDVECDVCTGRKYKAIKSCLVCLNSYCQNHFEHHEEFHPGKRHKVMDATRQLQEMICPQHDKLLEIFCHTDQQCICYMCMLDEHKNHDTVSAAAERTEKQKQLEEMQRKYQQRMQERQKELREAVESHKCSAQAAVEDSERIFTELIRSIEKSRSEVTQLIRAQETSAVSQAEEQLKQLEQEIEDLRRRDAELKQLSHTDHHIHFLQSFQSLSVPPESTDSPNITVSSLAFDDVGKSVSHLKEKLEHFCREETEKISSRGRTSTLSFMSEISHAYHVCVMKLHRDMKIEDPDAAFL